MSSSQGQSNNQSSTKPIWSKGYWTGSGKVEVAIWENLQEQEDGAQKKTLSATITKSYKKGKVWKQSESFFPQDLAILSFAISEALAQCFPARPKKEDSESEEPESF